MIRVGGEREGQGLLLRETLEGGHRISRHPDNGVARSLQRGERISEVAGLLRATRRRGFRVEVHDDAARGSGEQTDRDRVPWVVWAVKSGAFWPISKALMTTVYRPPLSLGDPVRTLCARWDSNPHVKDTGT